MKFKLIHPKKLTIKSELITEEEARSKTTLQNISSLVVLIQELFATGLAAIQVGWPKKLIIVGIQDGTRFDVFMNPTYTPIKKHGTFESVEGSISFPEKLYKVNRWNTIRMTWESLIDKKWKTFSKKFRNVSILQHLIDLTNGVTIQKKREFSKRL